MGRHAAPPASRRARTPSSSGRRTSTATAGFLVAGIAAALALATLGGLTATGIDLLPRSEAASAPSPTPTPSPAMVDTSASPAQQAVVATLRDTPARGWVPASGLAWTGGTPFDAACGRPATDAAVSGTRIYAVGRRQMVATVSAYGAGTGAVAFAQWARELGSCGGASRELTTVGLSGAGRTAVAATGAEAFVAWIAASGGRPAASALFWRRGDTVAVLATPSITPDGLASAAIGLDRALLAALDGRCADLGSNLADAARSPWVDGIDFTGLTEPVRITVDPSPVPTPVGVTPVPPDWSPAPLPSVSYPVRPLDPVYPTELPSPVSSPVVPVAPAPAPTVTAVPSRVQDLTGPGCGWAFAGQAVPPYDSVAEQARADALAQQAHDELVGAQALYVTDVVSYWNQIPVYQEQAAAFVAYAAAVADVARQWDSIQEQRDDYALALAAYQAALQAQADFALRQADARAAYDAALAACAAATATPSATLTPTGPTPGPTPGETTPAPTPSVPGCPPLRPAVLDEQPPPVPPVPTPPPTPTPPAPTPTR